MTIMSLIIIISFFLLILLSIVGFGFLSAKILSIGIEKNHSNFFGLFGIVTLTFVSYLTNLFISHNFIHNILLLIIGLIAFLYGIYKEKINFKDIKKILIL